VVRSDWSRGCGVKTGRPLVACDCEEGAIGS